MSWLTGLVQGLGTAGVGYMQGQAQGEQERYEREMAERKMQEALRQQALADTLMNLKIDEARYGQQQRPILAERESELHDATMNYKGAQARHQDALATRPPKAERIDPLSPEGITASGQKAEAIARVGARYRKPTRDAAGETRKTRGSAILSTWGLGTPDQVRKFAQAFNALRSQGHSPEEAAYFAQEQVKGVSQEERRDEADSRAEIRMSRQNAGSDEAQLLQQLLGEEEPEPSVPVSPEELAPGQAAARAASPTARGEDPALEEMRREWDQLAQRFGEQVTVQRVGPRP